MQNDEMVKQSHQKDSKWNETFDFLASFSLTTFSRDVKFALAISVLTITLNQLIEHYVFRCPCIIEDELNANCTVTSTCPLPNILYGFMYLFAPAVMMLLAGIVANDQVWKVCTGCCWSSKGRPCSSRFFCVRAVLRRASFAPIVWIGYSLFDGDFIACATTSIPYIVTENDVCADLAKLKRTDEYYKNHRISQTWGLFILVCFFAVGILAYSISRCCLSKTYYREKYSNLYREREEEVFDQAMKTYIKNRVDEEAFLDRVHLDKAKWDEIALFLSYGDNKHMDDDCLLHLLPRPEKEGKEMVSDATTTV